MRLRHVVSGIAVLTLLLTILASGHYYLARRLVLDPQWSAPLRMLLLVGIGLLGSSLVLQPVFERRVSPALARLVAWPASLWMGFIFFSLTLLLLSDGLFLVLGRVRAVIFTMYRTRATPSQVLSFGSDNELFAVTMPRKWALSLPLPQELRKRGVFVYAHTVNSLDVWRELQGVGVSGIYTDFLIPAEIARVAAVGG